MSSPPPVSILVVDDDQPLRRALVRSLADQCADRPCHITECADGHEALARLTRNDFDCVFLDYQLPGGPDGLEVLRAARAAGVTSPVIILTGEGSEQLAVEMMKAGATDYFVKGSVRPDALGQALRHALQLRHAESLVADARARQFESDQRFRRLVEVADDGVWIIDADGNTTFVNAGAATMLGYRPDEMLGRSLLDFMDPTSRPSTVDALGRRRAGLRERRDCLMRHRNGTPVWTTVSAAPLTGPDGAYNGSFAVLTDVTHRKQTEQALRQSEERFRRIFEHGPVGMAMTGLDRRFIAVNAAFGRLIGRDPASLVGTRFDDITHPDDVDANVDLAERMRRGDVSGYRIEKRYLRPDGTVVWAALTSSALAESDDRPSYMLSIIEDVTERRAATDALRASEERFRSLFQSSPVPIGISIRGITQYANPAYLRLFGYDRPEQIIGHSLLEQIAPPARAQIADRAARRARGEPAPDAYDTLGLRRDGSEFPFNVRVGYLQLPEGLATIVFATDLTESNRLREQLSQAQRMESLGRLAGGIAHDFNNLLAVISGYAESLRRRFPDAHPGGPAAAPLDEIERAADRGARLVKQLLAFSRSRPVQPQRVDLAEVACGVCQMLRQVISTRIVIDCRSDGAPAWIDADPGQIEQMLVNLTLNARDAMPDGGTLTIDTRHLDVPPTGPAEAPGRFVLLTVSDTGAGIDEPTRRKLFEPFFTTKPEGTGLGLAIVYGIVTQQNGHLSVHSEPQKGTRFEILLPAAKSPPAPAGSPSPAPSA